MVIVVVDACDVVDIRKLSVVLFFFFNDTATTEIYTLSLHDALPICPVAGPTGRLRRWRFSSWMSPCGSVRSEEHTSELQSRLHLVCRLLLEKKKTQSLSDKMKRFNEWQSDVVKRQLRYQERTARRHV